MKNEIKNEILKEMNWKEKIIIKLFYKIFLKLYGIAQKNAINNIIFYVATLDVQIKQNSGVNSSISYSVSVQDAISDVKLWRIIVNGYPYKTIEELGCNNKEEAFTATKQAIYCYIHGNNPEDYRPIGEAGTRTLRALNQILNNANQSTETQISNIVKIIKEKNNFEVDEIEKEYVSKIYSIQADTEIKNYKVELTKSETELPEGIKITDMKNNIKGEFTPNEKFKVLIPIKNLTKEAKFNIQIDTKINSKPVLYGKAENTAYQDYALTAATYEDATGNTKDIYYKNETKIKIIKQDQETKERLENVEFNILDNNKNIIYANLRTNNKGEIQINNLIPGKYYIQETSSKDGYILDEKLIEINVKLNEELTVTINNLFEKRPKDEPEETETTETIKQVEIIQERHQKTKSETVVKKLPVTGMQLTKLRILFISKACNIQKYMLYAYNI